MRAILLAVIMVSTLVSGASAFNLPSWGGGASDKKAAAPQSNKADEYFTEARRAYGSASYPKTIEMASKAIQESPKYAEAFALRGKAYKDTGDIDNAVKDLNRAIALNPHLGEAYYVRAQANEINGEMKQATADYKMACAEGYKDACK